MHLATNMNKCAEVIRVTHTGEGLDLVCCSTDVKLQYDQELLQQQSLHSDMRLFCEATDL